MCVYTQTHFMIFHSKFKGNFKSQTQLRPNQWPWKIKQKNREMTITREKQEEKADGKVIMEQILTRNFPGKYLSLQTEKTPQFGQF